MKNILFVDDDCNGFLAPLVRILQAQLVVARVRTAETYCDAIDLLMRSQGDQNSWVHAVLLDLIIPYDRDGRSALVSDLGIKLADQAANVGVSTIAFLTAASRDEVVDRFPDLLERHPAVRFRYFDKTNLLAATELKHLISYLVSTVDNRSIGE